MMSGAENALLEHAMACARGGTGQASQSQCLQVGGLRDTVQQFSPYDSTGTGWTFEWADGGNFRCATLT